MTADAVTQISADGAPVSSNEAAEPSRLDELEAAARDGWAEAVALSREACAHLLRVAPAIAEAGALSTAEAFPDLIRRAGIPPTAVRNLLELHRVALDYEALERLGGVPLAAAWAAEARLPREGEALAVTVGEWQPDRPVPVAYVWRAPEASGGFHVGAFDLAAPSPADRATRGPLTHEPDVWRTVWGLLGSRHADAVFRPIRRDMPALVDRLEARRLALLGKDARRVH